MSDSTEKRLSEVPPQLQEEHQKAADTVGDKTQPFPSESKATSLVVPVVVADSSAMPETRASKDEVGSAEGEDEKLPLQDSQPTAQDMREGTATAESVSESETRTEGDKQSNDQALRDLVLQCIEADSQETSRENVDAAQFLAQLKAWVERQGQLSTGVLRLRDSFNRLFAECSRREQALPPEAIEALANRRESIKLCGRMLERLTNRITAEPAPSVPEQVDLHPLLQIDELCTLLQSDPSNSAEARSTQLLKERRIHNHKVIADIRKLVETTEKKFLTTVERQLLPIIDGLDEGRKVGVSTLENLSTRFAGYKVELDNWFAIYDELTEATLAELLTAHVQPMSISQGDPVDYELHEPVDVEEDPELSDEHVKEVVRRGYTILDADSETQRVLRSGQVVVVKNHKAE